MLGERKSAQGSEWCVASEDCAFGPIGFQRVRDVRPGEMIVITDEGDTSRLHISSTVLGVSNEFLNSVSP